MTHPFRALLAATTALSLTLPAGAHEDARKTELFRPGVEHAAGDLPPQDAATLAAATETGDFGFDPGTAIPEAAAAFRQGLALLWGFNHAAAVQAFRAGQALDPDCSPCHWGEAYALGPNLNDGMHEASAARAAEAARSALDTASTAREEALARALVARYAQGDRAALDRAFADAMAGAAAQFPDDANVQVIHADALMNLQPWDYWEADGVTPKGGGAEILAVLERAMAIAPDHPGALHLYIHAVEASADPSRAEAAADRLRGAVPMAGHLTHMPAHVYLRVGRYADAIEVNRAAIAADEAYLEAAGDGASALYRFGYYPHNLHFLLVGAQMAGRDDLALEAAEKLSRVTSEEVSGELAWVQAIDTAPYAAQAQLAAPEAILALSDPGDAFPFVKGHWHWARATVFALQGDLDAARAEQHAIEAIVATADLSGLEAQFLPAGDVLSIAKHLVEARIAQAEADWPAATHHLEEAIALEASIPYMEPPYWSYPLHQTLGAVRLQAGDADGAAAAFETALASHPNNARALWGLWQARKAAAVDQLDEDAVRAARAAFKRAWLGEGMPALDRL